MFSENFKKLRKSSGLSQEELAVKLCVVRQTVSKWENGLSVPDSQMLIKIAQVLETSVNVLLGEEVNVEEAELKALSEKLEILNAQITAKNERNRKIWRTVFIAATIAAVALFIFNLAEYCHYQSAVSDMASDTAIIGGYDGPTNILISNPSFKVGGLALLRVVIAVSITGIFKTGKK